MHAYGMRMAQPAAHWWAGLGADASMLMTGPTGPVPPTPAPAPVVQQQTVPLTQPTSTQPTPGTTAAPTGQVPLYQQLSTTPLAPGVKPPTDEDAAYLYTLINVRQGTEALFPFQDVTALWNDLWKPAPSAQDARTLALMGGAVTPGQPRSIGGLDMLTRAWGITQDSNYVPILEWAERNKFPWQTQYPGGATTWNWRERGFEWRHYEMFPENKASFGYNLVHNVFPVLTVIVATIIGAYGIGPIIGSGAGGVMGGAAAGAAIGTAATSLAAPTAPAAFDAPGLAPEFNPALLQQPAQGQVPLVATPGLPTNSFQYEAQSSSSPIPLTPEQEEELARRDDAVKGLLVVGVLGAIAFFGGK